uniref:Uncharacterized protein n=1 Tax=Tanacetum cinerariifolium TaxID=118510 RepID=A0A699IJC3_TANCI|nr:hypothetical protein [Tanacetum cinerariifolium]
MKESEVQAIKEIEKRLKESKLQQQESLVTDGTTLEANLNIDGTTLDASLVIEDTTLEACLVTKGAVTEARFVTKGATLDACLVNEGNENGSSDHESTSLGNDVDVGPSYDSDTMTKEEYDNVAHEQHRAFFASLINNLKCDVEKRNEINPEAQQGLGFENQNDNLNLSVLNKAKELTSYLYNIEEMGKDELSDHKITSEEELKCEAKKRLKVK